MKIICGVLFEDGMKMEYVGNRDVKRKGSKSWERWEKYWKVKSFEEYKKKNKGMYCWVDLRWDFEKGFVKVWNKKGEEVKFS